MKPMPVVFIGHGSPMNAIADNAFTQNLARLGKEIPKPKAVLCISAHWMTDGAYVTHMAQPKTIHDFYGFPKALFDVQYPAPGSVLVAELVQSKVHAPKVQADDNNWGLDHGTWSVLRHMYPKANVPVVQLSIDIRKSPEYHYELGKQLQSLRSEGVLVLGSGNIVHNLRQVRWEENAKPLDWAVQFDEWVKEKLQIQDHKALVEKALQSPEGQLSIPTMDHWYPFLCALGAALPNESLRFEHEGIEIASISMRCLSFGLS